MKPEVTFLTGAGLSHVIGLPMTTEFNHLVEESKNYGLYDLLSKYLGTKFYDIEAIMSTISDMLNSKDINNYIIQNPEILGASSEGLTKVVKTARQSAGKYSNYIKFQIYNILEKYDIDLAEILYLNLLTSIRQKYPTDKISIFTANYDLSFEKALIKISTKLKNIGLLDVNFGFKYQFNAIIDNLDRYDDDYQVLDYYKLHGSLDWHYDKQLGLVKTGTNAKPSDPNVMPILYPGFKGKPVDPHFIKIHNLFFNKLSNTHHLIIIGFAMRDPYINELINYSMYSNKHLGIVFYNPIPLESMPKESGIHELMRLFEDRIQYIEKGIEKDLIDFVNDFSIKSY